jgi:hypothetical protein
VSLEAYLSQNLSYRLPSYQSLSQIAETLMLSSNSLPTLSDEENIDEPHSPLQEDSLTYPSGLLKGDLPSGRCRKPWYADSDLDCITKTNKQTELAISIEERDSGFKMATTKRKLPIKEPRTRSAGRGIRKHRGIVLIVTLTPLYSTSDLTLFRC